MNNKKLIIIYLNEKKEVPLQVWIDEELIWKLNLLKKIEPQFELKN